MPRIDLIGRLDNAAPHQIRPHAIHKSAGKQRDYHASPHRQTLRGAKIWERRGCALSGLLSRAEPHTDAGLSTSFSSGGGYAFRNAFPVQENEGRGLRLFLQIGKIDEAADRALGDPGAGFRIHVLAAIEGRDQSPVVALLDLPGERMIVALGAFDLHPEHNRRNRLGNRLIAVVPLGEKPDRSPARRRSSGGPQACRAPSRSTGDWRGNDSSRNVFQPLSARSRARCRRACPSGPYRTLPACGADNRPRRSALATRRWRLSLRASARNSFRSSCVGILPAMSR